MKKIASILLLLVSIITRGQSAEVEMNKGVDAYYKKDYSAAMEWFKKAATIGFADAFFDVGALYEGGLGVKKDIPEAVKWYEQAGNRGQLSAMRQLTGIYYTGDADVEKDIKKSFYWNKKLALLGDTLSMFNVGVMYLNETGSDAASTLQALDSAALWFLRGVDVGAEKCKTGIHYAGIGFFDEGLYAYEKEDFVTALKLYGKGAKLGSPEAMTNLGEMYYNGKGTKEDVESAKFWLQKAAGLGFNLAKENLKEINDKPRKVLMVQVKLPNGTYVEKKWDNSINGVAKYTYPNGDSYEGMFKNGDFDGEGKFKWASGHSYSGTFLENSRSGRGKQFYEDGSIEYEGEWLDDAFNGEGTYYYLGGDKYIGTFKNNLKNGKGKMISTTGNLYEGEWQNSKEHGKGKMTWSDGTVYEGSYNKGNLEGLGAIIYADGAKSIGYFVDGGPSGKWVYTAADGRVEERYFKSPGMYSVYKEVETGYDAKKVNDEYNAWWEKTYGKGGSQNSNNMSLIRQQKEQETFDQRRQKERDESQRRIAERERSWERSTDNYNRKYGRY